MHERFRRLGVGALAVLIGAVFIYAGAVKLGQTGDFADKIAGYRLLPPALDNLLAIGLPPFEIVLGSLLVVGWRRRTMAFCALLLTGIFLVALLSAGVRGIALDCGCFGNDGAGLTPRHRLWMAIGRDLLLLGAAGVVYLDGWTRSGAAAKTKPPPRPRTDRGQSGG